MPTFSNCMTQVTRIDRDTEDALARLEALARLMDGAFEIPGTNIRFGLDAVVGLLPVAGDMIGGLISSYLIWEARRLKVPKWIIARMSANVLFDTTLGAVPIIGDLFDVAFRANMKNASLLRRHLERKGLVAGKGKVLEGEAVKVGYCPLSLSSSLQQALPLLAPLGGLARGIALVAGALLLLFKCSLALNALQLGQFSGTLTFCSLGGFARQLVLSRLLGRGGLGGGAGCTGLGDRFALGLTCHHGRVVGPGHRLQLVEDRLLGRGGIGAAFDQGFIEASHFTSLFICARADARLTATERLV